MGTDACFTRAAACAVSSARILPLLSGNYSENGKFCKNEIVILFDAKSGQNIIHTMIKPEELDTLLIRGICKQVPIDKVSARLITLIPIEGTQKREVWDVTSLQTPML